MQKETIEVQYTDHYTSKTIRFQKKTLFFFSFYIVLKLHDILFVSCSSLLNYLQILCFSISILKHNMFALNVLNIYTKSKINIKLIIHYSMLI